MSAALRAAPDADVRAAIEHVLNVGEAAADRRPVAVATMAREPFRFESSATIDRVLVTLDDRTVLDLLVKDLSAAGLRPDARRIKPAFVHDPEREAAAYERVLSRAAVGTPRCFGWCADEGTGRSWLVLDHVAAPTLADEGDVDDWVEAARWVARLQQATGAASDARLLTRDAAWHRHWLARALTQLDARPTPEARDVAARLRWRGDALVERLGGLPRSFCHGELYPANVLLGERGERIVVVDWELAGDGPRALDLAALCGGSGWSAGDRRKLCAAYADEVARLGGGGPSLDAVEADVALCRLALAVQWLGWADEWRPPEGQGNDWAAEARTLLDDLEAA